MSENNLFTEFEKSERFDASADERENRRKRRHRIRRIEEKRCKVLPCNEADLKHNSTFVKEEEECEVIVSPKNLVAILNTEIKEEDEQTSDAPNVGSDEGSAGDPFYEEEIIHHLRPGPIPPPANNNRPFNQNDALVYATTFKHYYGLSEAMSQDLPNYITVQTGAFAAISPRRINEFEKELLRPLRITSIYLCGICHVEMPNKKSTCGNIQCRRYRKSVKRCKTLRRASVHILNITEQIQRIINRTMEETIDFHESIHLRQGQPFFERSDSRMFPMYSDQIESYNDFTNRNITLLLNLSYDGFRARRLSKLNIWPLYMSITSIEPAYRYHPSNMILVGMTCSMNKPSSKEIRILLARVKNEMRDLTPPRRPLIYTHHGQVWRIGCRLTTATADYEAIKILYGVPNWNQMQGCHHCYFPGIPANRAQGIRSRTWYCANPQNFQRRTRILTIHDARRRRGGLSGVRPMMYLLGPDQFPADALHIIAEGLIKDRCRDMFTTKSINREMKIEPRLLELIKKGLEETENYTYSRAFVLGFEDRKTVTGAESEQMFFVVMPLVASASLSPAPSATVSNLGLWMLTRILQRTSEFDIDKIRIVQQISELVKDIWSRLHARTMTMKAHGLFDHSIGGTLEQIGSPYHWTSIYYESTHRRLQLKINQTTTNSIDQILKRFVMMAELQIRLQDVVTETNHRESSELLAKVDNESHRFPEEHRIDANIYFPSQSQLTLLQVKQRHRLRIGPRWMQYSYRSRIVIRGKIYAAKQYWNRNRDSRQDVICLTRMVNNQPEVTFGSIDLILHDPNRNRAHILLKQYVIVDPFRGLSIILHNTPHVNRRSAMVLLDIIRRHNIYFHRISNTFPILREASEVSGPAIETRFRNTSYVSVI